MADSGIFTNFDDEDISAKGRSLTEQIMKQVRNRISGKS